ncbi:hypothetical protein [Loigolactobacillus binensis]|uniref:Uncharacterized protein n=1 Tax=Loigolactobacillus binensis TaxID=2559922 RepID=A0ABW3ECU4_9LACO|nr:hypothetical protein [Loigolactobacillus binensis]
MAREDLILVLQLITQRLRNVRRLQFTLDFLFAYILLRVLASGQQLTILSLGFTRGHALAVAFLLALVGLWLHRIRQGYRRNGQEVIVLLGEARDPQEVQLYRQFKRY